MLTPIIVRVCSKLTIETLEQRCEKSSKLTIKTPKQRHWRRFGVFIVNFEHISHLCSSVFIVNLEQLNADWEDNCVILTLISVNLPVKFLWKRPDIFCYEKINN